VIEPFFFAANLFGVWRTAPFPAPTRASSSAKVVWVLAPPFAEEEKSARRVLTEIALQFQTRGEASLLFSFRGQGDSGGDFAGVSLDDWRADLASAIEEAKRRAPGADVGVLGVRLGASLGVQVAAKRQDIAQLVLIEPLLSGRSFLSQQLMRQKIRAQMTGESTSESGARSAGYDDLDGWPLGAKLKSDLQALDLNRESFGFQTQARIIQVGPKSEVAAGLRALGDKLNAPVEAVVIPPFWNLLDYSDPAPLLERLSGE
jgi:hypothetical protein